MNADSPNASSFVAATLMPIALAARSLVRTARQCAPVALRRRFTASSASTANVAMATRPNTTRG